MAKPNRQLHFVIDETLTGPTSPDRPEVLGTVRVPAGVSHLRSDGPAAELLAVSDSPSDPGPRVEPLLDSPRPRLLLLISPDAVGPRINGRPALPVSLLRIGDQLLLEDGRLLHLTVESTPLIGPPTEDQLGRKCTLCHTPVTEDHLRIFTCPGCSAVMHHDDPEVTPAGNALECATLSAECLSCHRPIDLKGGFDHVPALDR